VNTRNIPVPAYVKAPASHRWLWQLGPPALITAAYRLVPPRVRRRLWNPSGGATSHTAMAAILAGGGWKAFMFYALPFHGRVDGPNMWWLPQPGGSLMTRPHKRTPWTFN
jgi:hypothetical protein